MNNKMIKGSVAGATGIVLLMGGFGTYALWSDSTTFNGNAITSGRMDISLVADAANGWKDASPEAVVTDDEWDWDSDRMVPGDVLELTQKFAVDAEGKNLEMDFSVDPILPSTATAAGTTTPAVGWEHLDIEMELNGTDLTETAANHFTATVDDGVTQTLVVRFTFNSAAIDDEDENVTLDLSSIGINVDQHRPGDTSGH